MTTVTVDGGGTAGAQGTAEADSDIEQVATQAPGTSIVSYEGPNSPTGSYDTWNAIVTQDTASVVSTSFGLCEPDSVADGVVSSEDTLFLEAAIQGQTILSASGDSGSEDCYPPSGGVDTTMQVDYPASDPYVTAVGGTTLLGTGPDGVERLRGAERRHVCEQWGRVPPAEGSPDSGIGPVGNRREWEWGGARATPVARTVEMCPIVSANAGLPSVFYVGGRGTPSSGRASPRRLIAGLIADTAQTAVVGAAWNIAQALYRLRARVRTAPPSLTSSPGDNDLTAPTPAPTTRPPPAYDPVTGLGSPIAGGWSCPEVSSVSPAEAPPGTEVTVTGLGLERASISSAGELAIVISATATSATVVVPAGSGTVSISATSAHRAPAHPPRYRSHHRRNIAAVARPPAPTTVHEPVARLGVRPRRPGRRGLRVPDEIRSWWVLRVAPGTRRPCQRHRWHGSVS